MSTTRWIIETPCEHGEVGRHWLTHWTPTEKPIGDVRECPGGSRIVVDPDNLPPEAIQRAAAHAYPLLVSLRVSLDRGASVSDVEIAEAIIRAFLSDPEPGDQT